jgi:pimeloyl-ACP methyl ester carboxylesterase
MGSGRRGFVEGSIGALLAGVLAGNADAAGRGRDRGPGLRFIRLFTGPDGESHFEVREPEPTVHDFFGVKDGVKQYLRLPATQVSVFSTVGNIELPQHNTNRGQMFFVVRGSSELRMRDGQRLALRAGDLLLMEDFDSKGRFGRIGPEGYTAINIAYDRPVAAGAAPAAAAVPAVAAPRNYVLVHGTGHGGWCWRHVATRLRAAGHNVYTPTLTGLGERAHLLSPDIGLDTHIQDVVGVIECEELPKVVIVGHSYGGYVITGVCDRLRERIEHAFYLDAPSPNDGDRNGGFRSFEEIARAMGPLQDGAYMPVRKASIPAFGIPATDTANTAWLGRRLTPHPAKTWIDPIHLKNGGSNGLPRTYVFCNQAGPESPLRRYAEQRRQDPTFRFRELPSGHDAMVVVPDETAKLLLDL